MLLVHVYRDDNLVLYNQLMCLFLRMTISPTLSILLVVLYVELRPHEYPPIILICLLFLSLLSICWIIPIPWKCNPIENSMFLWILLPFSSVGQCSLILNCGSWIEDISIRTKFHNSEFWSYWVFSLFFFLFVFVMVERKASLIMCEEYTKSWVQ